MTQLVSPTCQFGIARQSIEGSAGVRIRLSGESVDRPADDIPYFWCVLCTCIVVRSLLAPRHSDHDSSALCPGLRVNRVEEIECVVAQLLLDALQACLTPVLLLKAALFAERVERESHDTPSPSLRIVHV